MTHEEFKNKYLGQLVDWDGVASYQCADIAKAYASEVWGVRVRSFGTTPTNGGVINAFKNYPNSFIYADEVDLIVNEWGNVNQIPRQGDIVIWGDYELTNHFGHIAVVDVATTRGFASIDQNWGPDLRTRIVNHDYRGVLGWLRPRNNTQQTKLQEDMQQLREYFNEQVKVHNLTQEEITRHAVIGRPNGLLNDGKIKEAVGEFETRLQWVLNDRERDASKNTPILDVSTPIQATEAPEVQKTAPKIDTSEVTQLIVDTGKKLNLNDWAMGWLTFGIDKWATISSLIAYLAYQFQGNIPPKYQPYVFGYAGGVILIILIGFIGNKLIDKWNKTK